MTDIEILKSIAENLAERKSAAALSNYEVLSSNIRYVNELLKRAMVALGEITGTAETMLADSAHVAEDFQDPNDRAPFTKIVPRVLSNGLSIIQKFVRDTEPDDRSDITIENVGLLRRDFPEYSDLATTARQTVDSLISDGYQLLKLDPKELNYHVLVSLNSFDKYVTPSIRHALFNDDVTDSLNEFSTLTFQQWSNSPITRCQCRTFGQKVDYLFEQLSSSTEADLADTLKDLFKFTSEFTHIGYVSTFFSSSATSEVIFGDDHGPYLPSTENFSELKYEILVSATRLIAEVYIPCVRAGLSSMLLSTSAPTALERLDALADKIKAGLKTRNSEYYFFVKAGLPASEATIELPCRCGEVRHWAAPHDTTDLYCKGCGSSFRLMEIEGDSGYVITSKGPVKVIGCDVPDFHELPREEQLRMLRQIEEIQKGRTDLKQKGTTT